MLNELIESAKTFERAGAWDEALARYERALRCLPREGDAASAADVLRWIGTVHRERGELQLASEAYETSLVIAELNALPRQTAAVLNCLGIVEHRRGNVDLAESFYTRALEAAVALEDERLAAMLDQNLGVLHRLRGNLGRALVSYGSALARSRALGETAVASQALNNMGMAHLDLQNWDEAGACFEEALALADAAGDRLTVGTLELNRAELHLQRRDYHAARECCERSIDLFVQLKSKLWMAEAYKFYGILHRATGRPEQADAHFAMALGLAEAAENRLLQAESQMEWAVVHLEAGRHRQGITYLNLALSHFGELQAQREVVGIQEGLEKMESLYLPAVERWSAELLEAAGPGLAAHAKRVATLSCQLADELGIDGWERIVIRVGALVHDIGYTALVAPNTVSGSAAEAHPFLKAHPVAGDAIAQRLAFPPEVRSIVRGHHERVDGGGFPDGLAGEEIALPTRIVAVADAFDRCMHPRSSGPALSPNEALIRLRPRGGTSLDAGLLEALGRALCCAWAYPGAA